MRLGLLIRDTEYRDALVEAISSYDNDIFVDIIGKADSIEKDALILTDIHPSELEKPILKKIAYRTVFLCTGESENEDASTNYKIHKVFKYCSIVNLLAYITDVYSDWRGSDSSISNLKSNVLAICSDLDTSVFDKCTHVARQIIYLHGGSVLIIPLGYINDFGSEQNEKINRFAKLMYMTRSGRITDPSGIAYTDSYGVSTLMLPSGINPLAYLNTKELSGLISTLSRLFDTVILQIGCCYRTENLDAFKKADHRICFESGRRRLSFEDIFSDSNYKLVRISGDSSEAMIIDDIINEIY